VVLTKRNIRTRKEETKGQLTYVRGQGTDDFAASLGSFVNRVLRGLWRPCVRAEIYDEF
jgi:hypothetical protein